MTQRVPEPKLREYKKSYSCPHAHVTRPRLQGNSDVPSSSINDALSYDGTKLSDVVLMFVSNDPGIMLTIEGHFRGHGFRMLDEDHG